MKKIIEIRDPYHAYTECTRDFRALTLLPPLLESLLLFKSPPSQHIYSLSSSPLVSIPIRSTSNSDSTPSTSAATSPTKSQGKAKSSEEIKSFNFPQLTTTQYDLHTNKRYAQLWEKRNRGCDWGVHRNEKVGDRLVSFRDCHFCPLWFWKLLRSGFDRLKVRYVSRCQALMTTSLLIPLSTERQIHPTSKPSRSRFSISISRGNETFNF